VPRNQPPTSQPYNKTSACGVIARAGRAHEDTYGMTVSAREVRIAKYVAIALKKNPALEPLAAARAGQLLMRADMLRLARKSAEARRAPDVAAADDAA
jgi:hypothetical protein